jgi:hypothetical protein
MTNVTPIHPLNGPMEQTPAELGEILAERMQEGGRPLAVTFLICRQIRGEAINAWTSIWVGRRAQEARERRERQKRRGG